MTTKDIVLVALFAAIIVALGFLPPITLAFIPVPITAQSMGVMLAGCVLGARRGAAAALLLLVLVAIGLPVLSGGRGGLTVFTGPTGGYAVGFVFAAYVTGLIAERMVRESQPEVRQFAGFFLAAIVGGILVDYAFGITWLCFSTGMPLAKALYLNLTFIPGDLIKAGIATLAARAVLAGYPMLPSRA